MGERDMTAILLSIGGTVCGSLVIAIKILWGRVESLTDVILTTKEEVGKLRGKQDYITSLHKEVLEIIEEKSNKK